MSDTMPLQQIFLINFFNSNLNKRFRYTAIQTFGVSYIQISVFLKFLLLNKFVWSKIKTQYYEKLLQYKITVFYLNIFVNVIYSCDAALNFQQHFSSLCHMIVQKSI